MCGKKQKKEQDSSGHDTSLPNSKVKTHLTYLMLPRKQSKFSSPLIYHMCMVKGVQSNKTPIAMTQPHRQKTHFLPRFFCTKLLLFNFFKLRISIAFEPSFERSLSSSRWFVIIYMSMTRWPRLPKNSVPQQCNLAENMLRYVQAKRGYGGSDALFGCLYLMWFESIHFWRKKTSHNSQTNFRYVMDWNMYFNKFWNCTN